MKTNPGHFHNAAAETQRRKHAGQPERGNHEQRQANYPLREIEHEDGRENESLSIEHQKEYLEEYAARNGFTNLVHRTDDGWSGTRWDRPGFLQIMEDIERGDVG